MIFILLLIILFPINVFSQLLAPAIGSWREHLPYNSAIDVSAGDNKVYAATPYSLFAVNLGENTVERMSRVTGLNETGISAIQYDPANKKLVIAYSNSNIDIIFRNDVYNIPGIKRSTATGDKTIIRIFSMDKNYYLSTGLGVIVVDGERYEIKDTWYIGVGGNPVRVNGFTRDGIYYYAATEEGLKRALVNAPNLANPLSWTIISGNGLAAGPCKNVMNAGTKLVVQKNDSLFVQNGSNWNFFYADGWPIVNSNLSDDKIMLCQQMISGISKLTMLSPDGSLYRTIANSAAV